MGVTYSQVLLDRATAYVAQPLSARRYEQGLAEVTALYSEITGQPASTCRQCQYSNYLAVVQAYIRQATRELHPETMAESTYTIAPGFENETFVHEGYAIAVTAENLTDEAAEFFIDKGFKHAFVKKAAAESPKTEGDKPPTEKQTLQARYKELHGEEADAKLTIADLKEAIKAKEDAE